MAKIYILIPKNKEKLMVNNPIKFQGFDSVSGRSNDTLAVVPLAVIVVPKGNFP